MNLPQTVFTFVILLVLLFAVFEIGDRLILPRLYRLRIIDGLLEAERVGTSDIGTDAAAMRWELLTHAKSSSAEYRLEDFRERIDRQLNLMAPHIHVIDQNLAEIRDRGRMHPAC